MNYTVKKLIKYKKEIIHIQEINTHLNATVIKNIHKLKKKKTNYILFQ